MTTRRLRFAVGAALLLGTPACEDDDVPIGCNPSCFDGGVDSGYDAGWRDAGTQDAETTEARDSSAEEDAASEGGE